MSATAQRAERAEAGSQLGVSSTIRQAVRVCAAAKRTENLVALLQSILRRPDVLLIHGTNDPVVPVEASGHALAKLEAAGIQAALIRRPGLAHGIDQQGAEAAARFLMERLPQD